MEEVHYDELWKNIIEKLFPHFLSYFMPTLYADADLSLGYIFLDKELDKLKLKGKQGKNVADKLVKITLKSGVEKWLLIHIEVQGDHIARFGQRMFRYFYRIYDKYDAVDITALAVFTYKTDNNYDFDYNVYGTLAQYRYNKSYIFSYNESDLLLNQNPFALVCLAVQYAKEYKNDDDEKYRVKRNLMKLLKDRKYSRDEIR